VAVDRCRKATIDCHGADTRNVVSVTRTFVFAADNAGAAVARLFLAFATLRLVLTRLFFPIATLRSLRVFVFSA